MQLRSVFPWFLMLLAFTAHGAEPSLVTVPAFSQKFIITLPAGWKPGYSANDGYHAIAKFAPADRSSQDASQTITIQAYRGVADRTAYDSTVMLRSLFQEISEHCKQEVVNIPVRNPGFLGYDTALAVLGCPESADGATKGGSDMGVYLAIKGNHDMYLIGNLVSGHGFTPEAPPINQSNYREYLAMLAPMWLCDPQEDLETCRERNVPRP